MYDHLLQFTMKYILFFKLYQKINQLHADLWSENPQNSLLYAMVSSLSLTWLGSTHHHPSGKYKSVSLCFSNLKSNFYNSSFQQLYGKEI